MKENDNRNFGQANEFPIVGIGASAGGLRAIEDFFDHMPCDSGAAFVIIQHLSPDFKSLMKDILGQRTKMPIKRVIDGMTLTPDTIFLIPPGQNLVLKGSCLRLTAQDRDSGHPPHFPIDLFFQSLSTEGKERAIGIILSGTGSDGARGIKHISEMNGSVMVQDPETAEFDGMPRSAIATRMVDLVMPAIDLAKCTYKIATAPNPRKAIKKELQDQLQDQLHPRQLQHIIDILERFENIDFTQYKSSTLTRRIQRRCLIAGHENLGDYIHRLEASEKERHTLRNDLLITVTRFFRDKEAWQYLEHSVLPNIIERAVPNQPIRIWVTACATGEEAYSMAILLREMLDHAKIDVQAKIFATDIDPIALNKASAGIYPASALSTVSEAQLERFFVPKNDGFEVSRSLREMIIFASHNLTRDVAFTQMDLVSCRNVLIYMQPKLQNYVIRNLHFALKKDSILFLGESENLGELEDEFDTLSSRWKIYQKLRDVKLPLNVQTLSITKANQSRARAFTPRKASRFDPLLESAFSGLLRNREATCFLVDRDNQLIHLCGDNLRILQLSPGRASQDVMKMLPKSLQLPINTAIHRARRQEEIVRYDNCQLIEPDGNLVSTVSIEVSLQKNEHTDPFILVFIERRAPVVDFDKEAIAPEEDTQKTRYILHLQQELQMNRESLQSTIEELETTNEEQQSTNEELIASNEELQSTNEELHSVNEELYTVNAEYQAKIQELIQLNSDHDNLLDNIDIGVIYLDEALRIRKFTTAATAAFNLVNADIGRPLEHLTHNLEDVDIPEKLEHVRRQLTPTEYEVQLKNNGDYLLMQISPYFREKTVVDGFIVTLVDVNDIKKTQQQLANITTQLYEANDSLAQQVRDRTAELKSSQQLLQSVTQATPNAIYIYDLTKQKNVYTNAFIERLLGYTPEELFDMGERFNDYIFHPDDWPRIIDHHETIRQSTAADDHIFEIEYRVRHTDGRWIDFYSKDIVFTRSEQGQPIEILGTAIDISAHKAALQEIRQSEERYRQLYQSTPVMMHSIDSKGIIHSVNDHWTNRLGYKSSEVIGQPISQFLMSAPEQTTAHTLAPKSDTAKQDNDIAHKPMRLNTSGCHELACQAKCKDGQILDILLSAVPNEHESKASSQLLTVLIDVTQRNRAEQELTHYKENLEELVAARAAEIQESNQRLKIEAAERLQAQQELAKRARSLERSNADLEQFAYVVSHDLQEPLRAVTIFTQLLQQRYQTQLDETASGYINHIVEGGIRMQALVDGILDFSRITHRGQTLETIDLGSVIETVVDSLRRLIQETNTTVNWTHLPTITADQNQISQLFQNLISNAIKFRSNEPPNIQIEAAPSTAENEAASWHVIVKDNGIGINPKQKKRIFSLFQRLHTREEAEGYGIGLAICKKIVERHNGAIWVESQPGKGAEFHFTLAHGDVEERSAGKKQLVKALRASELDHSIEDC